MTEHPMLDEYEQEAYDEYRQSKIDSNVGNETISSRVIKICGNLARKALQVPNFNNENGIDYKLGGFLKIK